GSADSFEGGAGSKTDGLLRALDDLLHARGEAVGKPRGLCFQDKRQFALTNVLQISRIPAEINGTANVLPRFLLTAKFDCPPREVVVLAGRQRFRSPTFSFQSERLIEGNSGL